VPEQTSHKITLVDRRLDYRGGNGLRGHCRFRVFATVVGIVAVLTERADNPGPSVTNSLEQVVAEASKVMGWNPDQVFWIEHYGKDSRGGQPGPDTFDRIQLQAGAPRWESMPRSLVHELLGEGALD
jgi:hypothetical protein